jgi:hypothetical protein
MRTIIPALFLVAACCSSAQAATVTASPRFISISREGADVWLLPESGEALFHQTAGGATARSVVLHMSDGTAFRWETKPISFVHWQQEWLVANGRPFLSRFAADGRYLGTTAAPVSVTDVAMSGGLLWTYSFLDDASGRRLWTSRDAKHFTAVPVQLLDEQAAGPTKMLDAQFVLGALPTGLLAVIPMTGAPVVTQVSPTGAAIRWTLAYLRSRARAALEHYRPGADDLLAYSAPARDVLAAEDGTLVVLRNREDLPSGKSITVNRGVHVDRYDSHGRHVGTATLTAPARFLLRPEGRTAVAVTDSGAILTAPFGAPIAGRILP